MLEVLPCFSLLADDLPSEGKIMQTEDIDSEEIDEIESINPASFLEMTVKEEVDEEPVVNLCDNNSPQCEDQLPFEDSVENSPLLSFVGSEHEHFLAECSDPTLTNSRLNDNETDQGRSREISGQLQTSKSKHPEHKTERGRGRGRRRSRWKLKFHHQALPPEYLDHYEATMAQQNAAEKLARSKVESVQKPSTTRSVPPLVPRSVDQQHRMENFVNQNFVNSARDAGKLNTNMSLVGNLNIDQLQAMTVQPFAMGSEMDILSRLQNSFHSSKKRTTEEKRRNDSREAAEKFLSKGLLSSLLSTTHYSTSTPNTKKQSFSESDRQRSSVIMSSSGNRNPSNRSATSSSSTSLNTNPSRVMKYQDLPYMGEITLDNMKPRRGRKPKKADICHLIYKNYGTIFPGAPDINAVAETHDVPKKRHYSSHHNSSKNNSFSQNYNISKTKTDISSLSGIKCKPIETLKESPPINHADVQNRIISSLLEKRLTAASLDAKRNLTNSIPFLVPKEEHRVNSDNVTSHADSLSWNINRQKSSTSSSENDEPLNLCMKDLNQLKIRLLRKHGNFYEPRSSNEVTVKSEPESPSETEEVDVQDSLNNAMPKFSDDTESTENGSSRNETPLSIQKGEFENGPPFPTLPFPVEFSNKSSLQSDVLNKVTPPPPLPGGYVYWPNAGLFVNPMALQSQLLYYQKTGTFPLVPMTSTDNPSPFIPPAALQPGNLLSSIPTFISPENSGMRKEHQKLLTNNAVDSTKDTSSKRSSASATKAPVPDLIAPKPKRLAPAGNLPQHTPTKRKRSAIFIPPVPSENNNNPTTEVSICKFKFTGGAKPSLQEKKMLSVDSGGNFRYYSGTGDKSMRGYEFFPRESLQQSTLLSSSSTPAENFLNAAVAANTEKMSNSSSAAQSSSRETTKDPISEDTRTDTQNPFSTLNRDMPDISAISDENMQKFQDLDGLLPNNEISFDAENQPGMSQGMLPYDEDGSGVDPNQNDLEDEVGSSFKAKKKRKTRKSLAREKLEKTFKEKGFLIQTQQLESAEGATYCKFRQLRKFTRYLFRSWKDYLPGNVRDMSVAAGVAPTDSPTLQNQDLESEQEISRSNTSTPTSKVTKFPENSSPVRHNNS